MLEPRTTKVLDATVREVARIGESNYRFKFELASNYFQYARCLELGLFSASDPERLLASRVVALDTYRRNIVFAIDTDEDRLHYRLHAFQPIPPRGNESKKRVICASIFKDRKFKDPKGTDADEKWGLLEQRKLDVISDAWTDQKFVHYLDHVDVTETRVLELPDDEKPIRFPVQHIASSLADDRIELPNAWNHVATRYITGGLSEGKRQTGEFLHLRQWPFRHEIGKWDVKGISEDVDNHVGGSEIVDDWITIENSSNRDNASKRPSFNPSRLTMAACSPGPT